MLRALRPTWREMSRERLTIRPHILRASSHRWYEVLVLQGGTGRGVAGGQGTHERGSGGTDLGVAACSRAVRPGPSPCAARWADGLARAHRSTSRVERAKEVRLKGAVAAGLSSGITSAT